MKGFFEGRATFYVDGCDFAILNRLRVCCVQDVCVDDGGLRFTVPLKFMSHVKMVLGQRKYSTKVNKNFFGLVDVFYSRIALGIATLVAVVAFFILNGFVFNVRVIGVEGEQHAKIAEFVSGQGIRPLIHKSNGRAAVVAGEIVGNFDFVAHASSRLVGNTLIFNVYSVVVPEGAQENRDIVATSDGVITNLIVASGRAMVRVGDVVRQGDILIKGERQVGAIDVGRDEFGKLIQEGIYAPCRAVGEVLADVKFSEYGTNTTVDELLARIMIRTGLANFDKVESFQSATGVLEVVATINKSIV
jgi:similar to stage IV sporulation protein